MNMQRAARDQALTIEEYQSLPEDPCYRYELSQGRLVREPRPGARHGRVVAEVFKRLHEFVQRHDLGTVELECGYRLREQPAVVRGPDVSFIAKDRLPASVPVGFWPFAPDLAIEVLSPSNTASEIEAKVLEYLDAGTRMVWVIDPETRSARIYAGSEAHLVRESGDLSGGDILPELTIRLADILLTA